MPHRGIRDDEPLAPGWCHVKGGFAARITLDVTTGRREPATANPDTHPPEITP
jgi:hypothetical protein